MEKITLPLANDPSLSGILDKTLKKLAPRLGVSLALRGDQLLVDGDAQRTAFAKHYFEKLNELRERGHHMREEDLLIALDMFEEGPATCLDDFSPAEPLNLSRKSVNPKSLNQQAYLQAIKTMTSSSASGRPGRARPTWPWPWPWPSSRTSPWPASS